MTLLIHSMSEFAGIITNALTIAGARNLVEIGAEFGGMSKTLADHAAAADGCLVSIDPAPKQAFIDWAASAPQVRHLAQASLEAIPTLADIDAWVIDGDHNYYTVFNELQAIDAISRRDGKPLLAILHDVGWPCARRDFYYAPVTIPAEHRHAHDFNAGALLDRDELALNRGFRGNGSFAWALHNGGPRNGVLTAVEDFLQAAADAGHDLAFAHIPGVFGLGMVFDTNAPWAEPLAAAVAPLHNHPLLATLEHNRLANYLAVIDMQDRAAGR
jgi:hypothetical protein